MVKVTNSQAKKIKELLKRQGTTSISAKEFNKILSSQSSINDMKKKTNGKYGFLFKFDIEKIDEKKYLFTLYGRHISNNTYNGMVSLGARSAYKKAIKKAAEDYRLINKNELKKILPKKPFVYSVAHPTSYNKFSRDDDNCGITLKHFRDCITSLGFIVDDNREHFVQKRVNEVKSNEYKITILLESVFSQEELLAS